MGVVQFIANFFILLCYFVLQKTVVTTKSVEYMPFLLSFFLFLNGATWTLYAVLRWDIYLLVSLMLSSLSNDTVQCKRILLRHLFSTHKEKNSKIELKNVTYYYVKGCSYINRELKTRHTQNKYYVKGCSCIN